MSKVSDLYFTKIVTLGEGGLKDYVYFFNDLCVFSCSFQNIIYINFNFPPHMRKCDLSHFNFNHWLLKK